ncbi:MAG: NAD(P)H-dependent oxidoreductase subunit E [Tropicimonas sp.]|uniref:NAD(P)H-dependent oxidoreductase subunit E n=1 Tax=Tropicimonas sp. TaxID=2067044 RepID=UPI003A83583A
MSEARGEEQAGIWKSGRGKGRRTPKGRQFDPQALKVVRALLGDRPRRRDLLIEFLHLVQDEYGHLSAAHIRALAEEMGLPEAEVYEVASFYAHFDPLREGEAPPPALTIRVCGSLSCEMAGAAALKRALEDGLDPAEVRILEAPCMGRCDTAPTVEIGHNHVDHATPWKVVASIEAREFAPRIPDRQTFLEYRAQGGYRTLARLRVGGDWEQVQAEIARAGLRGLGGAGFPSGKKWGFVRANPGPRYLAVNGDEGEPGTFKDRHHLEREPHMFLEGMLIAAWAVEAERCYIYMRDEYPAVRHILRQEIAALEAAGLIAPGYVELRRGAGAYICGEESAMLESIEGRRGIPRHRPPFVAQVGLWGQPTLVHNVETLYWVARIARFGADAMRDLDREERIGLRNYSVSGRVKVPGVYLLPADSTIEGIIRAAGGMAEGHVFKAFQPGGPSSGILPATLTDLPLDFGTLERHGSFIGSAAVVVLSDQDDIRGAALNMLRFFASESCGQCTPCRVGCEKAVKLMEAEHWDRDLLEDLSQVMVDASICGLGQAAPNAIRLTMKHFPGEV